MSSKNNSQKTKKAPKAAPKAVDYSALEKDTRLIPIDEWDWKRVVYGEPVSKEIPDGSGNYRRVHIQYMYDDNTIGPAIVELGKHYCFGVQADNVDKDGKVLTDKNTGRPKPLRGYRVPIVMTSEGKNKTVPEEWEQREVDFFDDWRAEVVRYANENKKSIGKGSKNEAQIDAQVGDLLYRKKDTDGNEVEGNSPKLYANLIYFTNNKEMGTTFYGPGDKVIDPLKMTGHFYIYPCIRFDNIFIGGKSISLQHRIYDATVEPISRAPRKRLARANELDESAADDFNQEVSTDAEVEPAVSMSVNDMMESEEEEEVEDDE